MKVLPILVINVVTVTIALVVYEHWRDDPAPQDVVIEGGSAQRDALAKRIEALETAGRPLLRATGPDPRVVKRLEALEDTIGVTQAAEPGAAPQDEEGSDAVRRRAPTKSFEPTPAAIERFRKLRDAVHRQDRVRKNKARIDRVLDKLALNLNARQREKVHAAQAAFEPRVRQIWDQVKTEARETQAAGGQIDRAEIVSTTMDTIQQEFAASLEGVVSAPDAQAIAEALHPTKR